MSDFSSFITPLARPTVLRLDYGHDNCLYIHVEELIYNNGALTNKRSAVQRRTDKELASSILPLSTIISHSIYNAMKIVYPDENLETIYYASRPQFREELRKWLAASAAEDTLKSLQAVVKSDVNQSLLKMAGDAVDSEEAFKNFYMQTVDNDPPDSSNDRIPLLEEHCRGLHNIVEYPCDCLHREEGRANSLDVVIIHLNDIENWSREDIADWLESLDIDLSVTIE